VVDFMHAWLFFEGHFLDRIFDPRNGLCVPLGCPARQGQNNLHSVSCDKRYEFQVLLMFRRVRDVLIDPSLDLHPFQSGLSCHGFCPPPN